MIFIKLPENANAFVESKRYREGQNRVSMESSVRVRQLDDHRLTKSHKFKLSVFVLHM